MGHRSTLDMSFWRRLRVANRFAVGVLRVFPGLPEILADTKTRPTKKAAPSAVGLSEKSFRCPSPL